MPSSVGLGRRARPGGLIVQPRDVEVLRLVLSHRYLRSDHVHALLAERISRRVLQTRLKKLFEHAYVKRLYIPSILDGEHRPPAHSGQPIYTIRRRGVQLLKEQPGTRVDLDSWRNEVVSLSTLAHHLVVADCLVALAAASRSCSTVALINGVHEEILWSKLRAYRSEHRALHGIVPDGSFTLRYQATGEALTFYLEVVRADVRGGNRRLAEKLRRYGELNRAGFFHHAYGHEQLRAVLFATTSWVRAKNLAAIAQKLTHGRNLFWFGAYQEKASDGRFMSCFTPERILALPWQTSLGERLTILQPRAGPPAGKLRP